MYPLPEQPEPRPARLRPLPGTQPEAPVPLSAPLADLPLSPHLAAELLPVARGFVGPLRSYGVFAEALPSQPDDDEASTLLRFVGRDPHWPA